MKFQTVEEIINYAYEKEKEAAEFYEKAKNDETFAAIKEVSLFLAIACLVNGRTL